MAWLTRRLPQFTSYAMVVSGASIQLSDVIRDLGVIVDGDLSLAAHVSHVASIMFLPSPSAEAHPTFL